MGDGILGVGHQRWIVEVKEVKVEDRTRWDGLPERWWLQRSSLLWWGRGWDGAL